MKVTADEKIEGKKNSVRSGQGRSPRSDKPVMSDRDERTVPPRTSVPHGSYELTAATIYPEQDARECGLGNMERNNIIKFQRPKPIGRCAHFGKAPMQVQLRPGKATLSGLGKTCNGVTWHKAHR